ncbi:MAG: hypothetical protein ABSG00_05660 [Terracidiphilus sp.]
MAQAWQLRVFGAFSAVLMASSALMAQGDPSAIQQRLNAQYKLTTVTADRSDIVTAGDVVVIHKPGLLMYAVASPMPPSNTYKNGKIGQGWGGFGKDLMIGMSAPGGATAADYPHRPFVPEEKCWVTGIQVQKDGVLFQLYSDPYDNIRYYANLKIPFPGKKEVPSVEAAMQMVAEVLTVASADNQGGEPAAPTAEAPAPAPAPPAMETIAPPPPPADAPPPTIELGQTKDQVVAAFGQPARMAKVGVKEIFYYKDMKVTFTSGKVSNVE